MPIKGIEQPSFLQIDEFLRLRKFDGVYNFAFDWYQDIDVVYLVDGVKVPYTFEKLERMYNYLNKQGELYFIEILEEGKYKPIGDVTFWKNDMPIVLGDKKYRGKGIGRKVISALVERGRKLGYSELYVSDIYEYNIGSRKCFESVGFSSYKKTENGDSFVIKLR